MIVDVVLRLCVENKGARIEKNLFSACAITPAQFGVLRRTDEDEGWQQLWTRASCGLTRVIKLQNINVQTHVNEKKNINLYSIIVFHLLNLKCNLLKL